MTARVLIAIAVVATATTLWSPTESPAGAPEATCSRFATASAGPGGDGAATNPFASAQALVNGLRPGETGCLEGTFVGPVTIRRGGAPGRPMTLTSAPGTRARLLGVLWITRSASDVLVSGLDLDGSATGGAPSPQVNGRRVTFSDNDITNRHTAICLVLGGSFARYGLARDVLVERNQIHDCGRLPATAHDHGIYVEGARGVTIRENRIYGNADWGIHLYPNARNVDIRHNVVYGNGAGIIVAGDRSHASSGVRVEANVVAASTREPEIEAFWDGPEGIRNLVTGNCLWHGGRNVVGDRRGLEVRGNVVRSPRFVDAQVADFRSAPDDPCRGMGLSPG